MHEPTRSNSSQMLEAVMIGIVTIMVIVGLFNTELICAVTPICVGALFVFEIVRSTNRRHDPRDAKRPPDPP